LPVHLLLFYSLFIRFLVYLREATVVALILGTYYYKNITVKSLIYKN